MKRLPCLLLAITLPACGDVGQREAREHDQRKAVTSHRWWKRQPNEQAIESLLTAIAAEQRDTIYFIDARGRHAPHRLQDQGDKAVFDQLRGSPLRVLREAGIVQPLKTIEEPYLWLDLRRYSKRPDRARLLADLRDALDRADYD